MCCTYAVLDFAFLYPEISPVMATQSRNVLPKSLTNYFISNIVVLIVVTESSFILRRNTTGF